MLRNEEMGKYEVMLKDYFATKKKIMYINDKIINYEKLKEEGNSCEQVFQAQKDLIEDYKRKIEDYVFIENILETDCLRDYNLLEDRYYKGKAWIAVSIDNNLSLRQCFNVRDKALNKIKWEYLKMKG